MIADPPNTNEKHPRYGEWLQYCKELTAEYPSDPRFELPEFDNWLTNTMLFEDAAIPRIRGTNPPRKSVREADSLREKANFGLPFMIGGLVLIAVVLLRYYDDMNEYLRWGMLLVITIAIVIAFREIDTMKKEAEALRKPLNLFAYTREFEVTRADAETLKVTVHFELPANYQPTTQDSPTSPVRHLEVTTRTVLQKFAWNGTTANPAPEVEDHLRKALVQFQDEKEIAVLRVQVPMVSVKGSPPAGGGIYV